MCCCVVQVVLLFNKLYCFCRSCIVVVGQQYFCVANCGGVEPLSQWLSASSEQAKGAIAYRFHSEKLIRSLAN